MKKVAECEQQAAECRQLAAEMKNPQQRKQLEDMAEVGKGSSARAGGGLLRTSRIRHKAKLKNSILREQQLFQRHYLLVVVHAPTNVCFTPNSGHWKLSVEMFALCQKRTFPVLFDHLVEEVRMSRPK